MSTFVSLAALCLLGILGTREFLAGGRFRRLETNFGQPAPGEAPGRRVRLLSVNWNGDEDGEKSGEK
jgi:hypothetical protein